MARGLSIVVSVECVGKVSAARDVWLSGATRGVSSQESYRFESGIAIAKGCDTLQ